MAQRVVHQRAAKQRASVVHYQLRGERAQFRPSRDGVRYSSAQGGMFYEFSQIKPYLDCNYPFSD